MQERDRDGIVHIRFEPEMILGDALEDPTKATTILSQKVESWIRANPPQWLWAHRRFKNVIWPS
jgi:lauroyl/myristoyl acyltransferase